MAPKMAAPPRATTTKVPTRIGSWIGNASSVSRQKMILRRGELASITGSIWFQEFESRRAAPGKETGEKRSAVKGGGGRPAPVSREVSGGVTSGLSMPIPAGSSIVQSLATYDGSSPKTAPRRIFLSYSSGRILLAAARPRPPFASIADISLMHILFGSTHRLTIALKSVASTLA